MNFRFFQTSLIFWRFQIQSERSRRTRQSGNSFTSGQQKLASFSKKPDVVSLSKTIVNNFSFLNTKFNNTGPKLKCNCYQIWWYEPYDQKKATFSEI